MSSFAFDSQASRVVFGPGSLDRLADEADRLGARRLLVISTPGRSALAARSSEILGDRVAGVFPRARIHVPESVAVEARTAAIESGADCVVAVGGSSSIGTAKAVAMTLSLPIMAVPTTYAGSEMTPIWGVTRNGVKETGRDARVQPRVVIYDPDLTLGLPPRVTASSGMNALAHCVEAIYANDANPLTSAAAHAGSRLLFDSLPGLASSPLDRQNRSLALQGAWLAGFALGTVQMGLHHKLCHTLGGSFDLPHAETHAVLLPYTAAFNESAIDPSSILQLAREIGAPGTLAEIGLREQDIPRAADIAAAKPFPNPRPVTRDAIADLLLAAWRGDPGYR